MAVHLNRSAVTQARSLVGAGKVVRDERDAWSEHQPSAARENEFIRRHGWQDYGKWHLGVDDQQSEQTKARYKFPYGDFSRVHRCGVISAESRAGQYGYLDIERSARRLLNLIDARATRRSPVRKQSPRRKQPSAGRA